MLDGLQAGGKRLRINRFFPVGLVHVERFAKLTLDVTTQRARRVGNPTSERTACSLVRSHGAKFTRQTREHVSLETRVGQLRGDSHPAAVSSWAHPAALDHRVRPTLRGGPIAGKGARAVAVDEVRRQLLDALVVVVTQGYAGRRRDASAQAQPALSERVPKSARPNGVFEGVPCVGAGRRDRRLVARRCQAQVFYSDSQGARISRDRYGRIAADKFHGILSGF